MVNFNGKDREEILNSIIIDIETQKPILLPGGTWCIFCHKELCRKPTIHLDPIKLQLIITKLKNDLIEARK